ncbi:hypothetical protein BpHYR1_053206 [Brachionus plicatilis]|uniref:Uncharacterized protein n=1 Tax=Brachionus plicatilis TaxID=10195 RepID=A0A3M7PWS9_BRAPC|nr:hypothetical protein BpHYR1_053206 [Brachionus plicatilis]
MESKSFLIKNAAITGREQLNKNRVDAVGHDLNLNEATCGFVTQVNTNDIYTEKKNYLMEPSDVSDQNKNKSENDLKNLKSLNKEYDFVIPALNSQTNSFISAHKQLNNLKDESKKSFDYFPDIQIEKAKYTTKNMFDQNIYVKYLTKKVQSETRAKKQVDNSKVQARDPDKLLKAERLTKLKNNSFNYELSSNENLVDQGEKNSESVQEEKYPSIIMPIRPSFKIKISNKSKQKDQEPTICAGQRKTQANQMRSMSLKDGKVKPTRSESRHTELRNSEKKSARKIIDLNLLSNESIVSSHYMNQPARKFADLKLNENWPRSNMYKFTIQTNPWVRSFKEKSIANEINTNFRHISMDGLKKADFAYLPSRSDTKTSSSFFPNIKQISL